MIGSFHEEIGTWKRLFYEPQCWVKVSQGLNACFHTVSLPPTMAGKERVRDLERSKKSENN